jgi:predicted nucleic acid-binding protein
MTYVLDASALVKLVVDQTGSDAVRQWYIAHAPEPKFGPYLLWSEAGRVLQKERGTLSPGELASTHRDLLATIDLRPVPEALAWKHARSLTFYDAHYVALAEGEGATLVTCDRKMAAAAKDAGVTAILL